MSDSGEGKQSDDFPAAEEVAASEGDQALADPNEPGEAVAMEAQEAVEEVAATSGDGPTDEASAEAVQGDPEQDSADADVDEETEDDEDDDGGAADEDPEARRGRVKAAMEALIFVSDRVVTSLQLGKIVKVKGPELRELLDELVAEYSTRGIQLVEVSGGFQFRSSPHCGKYVQRLVAAKPVRLTRAQLETLALVAYRQPITRPEVDEVRGVDTGSAVKVLLERGLIKMLGRKDEAGRPMLYGTTPYFLEFFGLKTLRDLPTLKEFTDLSEENRILFKRKTGEEVEQAQAELAAEAEVSEHLEEAAAEAEAAAAQSDAAEPADGAVDGADVDASQQAPQEQGWDEASDADEAADAEAVEDAGGDLDGDLIEPGSDPKQVAQDPEMSGE